MKIKSMIDDLDKAIKTAKTDYKNRRTHNYQLYSGETKPISKNPIGANVDYINEVYPNIEIQRVNIGFRFPSIDVSPTKEKIYIQRVRGEDYQELDTFPKQVFQQMEAEGTDETSMITEDGQTVDFFILNGDSSAELLNKILPTITKEKNIESVIDNAKNDALLAPFGCFWVDYNSDYNIPVENSEYYKQNDIMIEYGVYGRDFLIDPSVKNLNDYHKAKWVAKCFFVPKDDLMALEFLKNEDGSNVFMKRALEDLKDNALDSVTYMNKDDKEYGKMSNVESVIKPKTDSKEGYKFWQVWKRPTLTEKLDPKSKFSDGKCFYLVENYDKEVSKPVKWRNKSDILPLHVVVFNLSDDKLCPTTDIEVYESQLAELANAGAVQRSLADISSRIKAIVNSQEWSEEDKEYILEQLNDNESKFVSVNGFKKDDIQVLTLGTQNTQIWNISNQLSNTVQRLALSSDASKGMPAKGEVTATATAVADRSSGSRNRFRQYILGQVWNKALVHIVALIRQYFEEDRIAELTGDTTSKWVTYSRKDVQGNYNIKIDTMSLAPADIEKQRNDYINLLNTMITLFDNPVRFLKILSEGHTINLSELVKLILDKVSATNKGVFTKVNHLTQQEADRLLTTQLNLEASGQTLGGGTAKPPQPKQSAQPRSQEVGATRGREIGEGQIVPSGGRGKIGQI